MAVYNLSNVTGSGDVLQFTQGINALSEGTFGVFFFITLLVILYTSMRLNTQVANVKIFAFTMYMGFILSAFMGFLNLVPMQTIPLMVMLSLLGVGLIFVTDSR